MIQKSVKLFSLNTLIWEIIILLNTAYMQQNFNLTITYSLSLKQAQSYKTCWVWWDHLFSKSTKRHVCSLPASVFSFVLSACKHLCSWCLPPVSASSAPSDRGCIQEPWFQRCWSSSAPLWWMLTFLLQRAPNNKEWSDESARLTLYSAIMSNTDSFGSMCHVGWALKIILAWFCDL